MANMNTTYAGLSLRNPFIISSSGLTNSVDRIRRLDTLGAGAIVLKSLFEEQIAFFIQKTVSQNQSNSSYPEAMDYISNYTRDNEVSNYLNLIREGKSKLSIPLMASINCVSSSEWITFAKKIEEAGADALELNLFVLPYDPHKSGAQNEQIYFDVAMAIV